MGNFAARASHHRTHEPISRREERESPMHFQDHATISVVDVACFIRFCQLNNLFSLRSLLPFWKLTACRLYR
jgi:hypothetical protein